MANVENIKNYIKQIKNFDLSLLYKEETNKLSWNNESSESVKKFVNNVLLKINMLEQNIDILDINDKNNLENYLLNFINSFNNFLSQTNQGQSVFNLHHDPLNWILNINSILKLYNLRPNENDIKNISTLYNSFNKLFNNWEEDKKNFEEAKKNIKEWTEEKIKAGNASLNGQKEAFKIFADNQNYNWWLMATFVFSLITFIVLLLSHSVFTFEIFGIRIEFEKIQNWYNIIPRILLIVVPSFLTIFCANQYNQIKTLKNSLLFKYYSIETMQSLSKTEQSEHTRGIILQRGIDAIFSEPQINKSDNKENYALILKLIEMVKKSQ